MTRFVALLRAINVAGHQTVAMADLRDLLGDLKLANPQTLLQSGNAVFGTNRKTSRALEIALEAAASKRLGLDTPWFLRSAAEWEAIITGNPFPREAQADPARLHVVVLKGKPAPAGVRALQASITGREVVRPGARHLYITYPDGAGRSRLTNAVIERALGTSGTARNWNTVLKLRLLLAP